MPRRIVRVLTSSSPVRRIVRTDQLLLPENLGVDGQALVADSSEENGVRWGEAVLPSVVDAKGDLVIGIGDNRVSRLPAGPAGYVLMSDPSVERGLRWAEGGGGTPEGLGTAAYADTGTGDDEVVLGNDERLSDARTPLAHTHAATIESIDGLQDALDAKATPEDITTAIGEVIDSAPGALDTLNELAAALGDDANFATTMTNALAGKADSTDLDAYALLSGLGTMATATASDYLSKAGNLSGIADPAAARTNLGLGTMATASASAYAALAGATFTGDVTFGTTSGIRLGYGGRFFDPDATRTVLLANGNKLDVLDETGASYLFQAGGNGVGLIATNGLTANANAASVVPLVAKGYASHNADFFTVQNSAGTKLGGWDKYGQLNTQYVTDLTGASPYIRFQSTSLIAINQGNAANVAFAVRGMAAQSGALTRWEDSSSTLLASVSAAGLGTFNGVTVAAGYDINASHAAAGTTRYGAGAFRTAATGINNTVVGATAGDAITSGAYNVLLGHNAGGGLTTGGSNVAVGADTLTGAASTNSVAVGIYALAGASAADNTALGAVALFGVTSGANNIGVGSNAGRFTTTQSNELFINSINRTNRAGDIAGSIIYGVQHATPSSQTLALNAAVTATYGLTAIGANYLRSTGTHVGGPGASVIIGADVDAVVVSDSINKRARVGSPHYTLAEEPVAAFYLGSESTTSDLMFGGGTVSMNAVTRIGFYTAANNTTLTGTLRAQFDSSGVFTTYGDVIVSKASPTIFASASSGNANLVASGVAGTERGLQFQTAGITRWRLYASSGAESGSHAGSNFNIARHNDSGVLLDTSLTIRRSDGRIDLRGNMQHVALESGVVGNSIIAHASQTADLQQWANSAGSVYAKIAAPALTTGFSGTLGTGDFVLTSLQTYGATVGATIGFAGRYNSSGDRSQFATIGGVKENGADGNGRGALVFYTSGTAYAERFRIGSDGASVFTSGAAGHIPLAVRGAASQTANLQEWQNSSSTMLARIDSAGIGYFPTLVAGLTGVGNVYAGNLLSDTSATNPYMTLGATGFRVFNRTTTSNVAFAVRGMASQSGNLQNWEDSAGTVLASVTSAGRGEFSDIKSVGANLNFINQAGSTTFQVRASDVNFIYRLYATNGSGTDAFVATGNSRFGVSNATHIPVQVRGFTSQTANLQTWENSSATVLASVSAAGLGTFNGVTVAAGYDINASHAAGVTNTRYGSQAMRVAASGTHNTCFGYYSMGALTSGSFNLAVGSTSLAALTTGSRNIGFGYGTFYSLQTGSDNTAVGMSALFATTGSQNTAVGSAAGYYLSSGAGNTFLGYYAGMYSTTQSNELFINSIDRTNRAGDIAGSIIYGVQHATPANQTLTLNAAVTATYGLTTTGLKTAYAYKTANYTATSADYVIDCSGTFTVTLPAASDTGRTFIIKNSDVGTITVDGNGAETIDGAATRDVAVQYQSITVVSTGTSWVII